MLSRFAAVAVAGTLSFAFAIAAYSQIDAPLAPATGYGVDHGQAVALVGPG